MDPSATLGGEQDERELRFDGRVALVTGAGRGLGRAHALLLAARGATVVVNDLGGGPFGRGSSRSPADEVVAEIRERGGSAVADYGNVASSEEADEMVTSTIARFGRLDIVVNNAGIDRLVRFPDLEPQDFDMMMSVHAKGAYLVTRAAWPQMVRRRYGRVVMTSSRAMFGIDAQAHYAAAKSAVTGLMRALSVEGLPYGIHVNAVMPSAWTRLNDAVFADSNAVAPSAGHDWPPELVSPAIAWLVHQTCGLTGEILDVGVGYVGRVFMGVTPGVQLAEMTIEAVAANQDEIMREQGYRVPRNTRDVPMGTHSLAPRDT